MCSFILFRMRNKVNELNPQYSSRCLSISFHKFAFYSPLKEFPLDVFITTCVLLHAPLKCVPENRLFLLSELGRRSQQNEIGLIFRQHSLTTSRVYSTGGLHSKRQIFHTLEIRNERSTECKVCLSSAQTPTSQCFHLAKLAILVCNVEHESIIKRNGTQKGVHSNVTLRLQPHIKCNFQVSFQQTRFWFTDRTLRTQRSPEF